MYRGNCNHFFVLFEILGGSYPPYLLSAKNLLELLLNLYIFFAVPNDDSNVTFLRVWVFLSILVFYPCTGDRPHHIVLNIPVLQALQNKDILL